MEEIDNKENFITAGYYLIRGAKPQHWMDSNLLPPTLWSASRCICEKIPDAWIFPWNQNPNPEEDRKRYQKQFGMTDKAFSELQGLFNRLLFENKFGYPNVFLSRSLAQEFFTQHFYENPDIKLISIALPEEKTNNFLNEFPISDKVAENGVQKKLRQFQQVEEDALPIGFDVLGYDYADFHSLLCFSMEQELLDDYDIRFNQLGMIDSYEKTLPLIKKIHSGELYLEDGFWSTWLVLEHPLSFKSQDLKNGG